ncbi:LOW QUALITY PROTEIN: cilia- and flagella-associated protein 65-like [Liolophura sinensis]|uniref:LOW QUALITY PROTEIN: cilia- and flagella-associated protein 65-like n=1 Tax=Liolophura sinensis TaxID=3198878 RepID=UPI0031597337
MAAPTERTCCLSGKVQHYGIEVNSGLVWQRWEAGKEYTKHIVLKNVKVKTEKIKYHSPDTRFFSTLYPKTIVLSAGTSFTLPVTFRPLERVEYRDKIIFQTKEGTFEVELKAVLPQVDILIPDRLEFPMCAAQDTVKVEFKVKNTGDLPTTFQWDVCDPFMIQPMEASFQPQSVCAVTATFQPQGASVYDAVAYCRYGPDFSLQKAIKLYGIGKYPHILVSSPGSTTSSLDQSNLEAVIQFDTIPIGHCEEKWVELHNLSPVSAPFMVERPVGVRQIDTVFHCLLQQGVVPAMSSIRIPITFTPNTVDTTSIDYFHVFAIGNVSKSVVKCVGSSEGPSVGLSSNSVNFMQINVGEVATRTVDVINNSNTEASVQFMIDCLVSVFDFDHTCLTMKPYSRKTIILRFKPQYPINYYRRISCLVHNQGPLFLDLIGTCHSELVKPSVLLAKHIDRYWTHVQRGFSVFSPEELNEMIKNKTLEVDETGTILPKEGVEEHALVGPDNISPIDEYFNDGFHCDVVESIPHVSLDTDKADFGNCQNLRIIEDKTINITNHTRGKITISWIGDSGKTFSVSPATVDLPPMKSMSFQVSFKPNAPNQFFGAELECFAYYKSLRDYRLTEDVTHCPPWCMTLTCVGHTFMPNNETFLPRYTLDDSRVVFPAVNANEATYRTILLTNTGTTPIMFDIEKDSKEIFSTKPSKGLLTQGHLVIVVKTLPTEVAIYKRKLKMRLNDSEKHDQELELWSSAESAEVSLESEGVMYLKPTCMGTFSFRTYSVKNVSRIPLRFEWKMKHADAQLLSVTPDTGLIQPNETQSHVWQFAPREEEKYVMKPTLIVWGQGKSTGSSGGKRKQFIVRAIGEGTVGEIKCDESYVNFGDVVVGSSAVKQLVIYNNSNCGLHYFLHVDQTVDEEASSACTEFGKSQEPALSLDLTEGTIPARARQLITATVRPTKRTTYQFAISYKLITPNGKFEQSTPQEPQYLCHLVCTGVFPVMTVTDARCQGSAAGISKKHIWNLFSLDDLNVCLDADPTSSELKYTTATRSSLRRKVSVYTRAILDLNFSAAPCGSAPCIITLLLENTGTVTAQWSFLFPSDLQMDVEHWSETGELDADELHQMKVMHNKLFSVEPKKGKLAPGQTQSVTFQYQHIMAGTDRLPVLLKMVNGREILLNFIGVTVDAERRYIHFPANKHLFAPVPVGEKISPKQIYEMYNGGAVPVKYEFDLTPLQILCKENFDQPVLECLNPCGELDPGKTAQIEWRFSPVEAKTYMVDVPIRVYQGDTAVITFTGVGYDKRIMGNTMPLTDQPQLGGVPSIQSVPVPGQLAYLSQERLSLGNLPLFSRARQMVSVTNRSRDHKVSFEWHVTSESDGQLLSIYPVCGHLEPGESQMCRVCFTARGVPSFYDLDLICEITDESEMKKYRTKMAEWEREKERQMYEFTITEDDLDADKRVGANVEILDRPRSGQLTALEDSQRQSSSEADLSKYKTLPPIKTLTADDLHELEKENRKKAVTLWERPVAPSPFILHLGVTARTHDVREFQDNFPEEYRAFFIDRALSEKSVRSSQSQTNEQMSGPSVINCLESEGQVVAGVLSNILRGLMDDTYFHDAVNKISEEPIPYFDQYRRPVTLGAGVVEAASEHLQTQVDDRKTPCSDIGNIETPDSPVSVPERTARGVTPKTGSPVVCPGSPPCTPVASQDTLDKAFLKEKQLQETQDLKKLPEFGNLSESIIENTLMNIMCEALSGEFRITARPRFIALPKKPASANSRSGRL